MIGRSALAIVLGLLLSGRSTEAQDKDPQKCASEAKEFFAGLEKAEVTFYQLDPETDGRDDKDKQKLFWNWVILQERILKNDQSVADLKELLADPKVFGGPASNRFDPGMAFRFKTENVVAEMAICLACSRIYSNRGERKFGWELSKQGVQLLMKIYRVHVPESKPK